MPQTTEILSYLANHVFFPLQLPHGDDSQTAFDRALCDEVFRAANQYCLLAPESDRPRWVTLTAMLANLRILQSDFSKTRISSLIVDMGVGGELSSRYELVLVVSPAV